MPGMPTVVQLLNQILQAVSAPPVDTGLGAKIDKLQASVDTITDTVNEIGATLEVVAPTLSVKDQSALDTIEKESGDNAVQSGQIAQESQPPS